MAGVLGACGPGTPAVGLPARQRWQLARCSVLPPTAAAGATGGPAAARGMPAACDRLLSDADRACVWSTLLQGAPVPTPLRHGSQRLRPASASSSGASSTDSSSSSSKGNGNSSSSMPERSYGPTSRSQRPMQPSAPPQSDASPPPQPQSRPLPQPKVQPLSPPMARPQPLSQTQAHAQTSIPSGASPPAQPNVSKCIVDPAVLAAQAAMHERVRASQHHK